MQDIIIPLAYLLAAVLFIFGLKGLSHPRKAVRGNLLGALGMLIAVVVTLFNREIDGYVLIVVGLAIGTAIGAYLAVKIEMTAMPQMVALFNGFGGIASVLVAGAEMIKFGADIRSGKPIDESVVVEGLGTLTLTGVTGQIGRAHV